MNAELLSDLEACPRKAYWSQNWEPRKLHPTEMLRRAIAAALTDKGRSDVGENAGEQVIGLCGNRGLDTKQYAHDAYGIGVHHAALADILSTHLHGVLGGFCERPEPVKGINLTWEPRCLLAPNGELVRIVLVDHWNDEREMSESRSWYTLGEMAAYKVPMTLRIIILGASVGGKRHSFWSKGLLHPRNRQLRFKKHAKKTEGFADSWIPIWREDYDQLSREEWLKAMEADGAITELTRRVHIDAFPDERVKELRGLVERKTERLYKIDSAPDPNYSACNWPRPCAFQSVCFASSPTTPAESGCFRKRGAN